MRKDIIATVENTGDPVTGLKKGDFTGLDDDVIDIIEIKPGEYKLL